MKNIYQFRLAILLLHFLFLRGISFAQCTISNGSFENWATTDGIFAPVNFTGLGIGRTTDAQSGQYAVKLSNLSIFGIDIKGSIFTFAKLNVAGCNGRPLFLTGFIKTRTDTLDTLSVSISITKSGVGLIGTGNGENRQPRSNYIQFHVPINYFSQETGDSAFIVITSVSPLCASKIDNIEFSNVARGVNLASGSVGINPPLTNNQITRLYPNPSNEKLNIHYWGNGSNYSIHVLDLSGKVVQRFSGKSTSNEEHVAQIDVSNLTTGMYYLRLFTSAGISIKKFSIVR